MKVLSGHTSPETAYVIEDYPYGFKLRCKIRYWIETSKRKDGGQRVMSQTTNPKIHGREVWNKPKASTYSDLRVLYIHEGGEEDGHVKNDGISLAYADAEKFQTFIETYKDGLQGKYEQDIIRVAGIVFERRKNIKYTITASEPVRIV